LARQVLSSGIEPNDELDEVKPPERSNRSGGYLIWMARLHAGAGELDYANRDPERVHKLRAPSPLVLQTPDQKFGHI
jgi:hypothetical protein